MGLESRSKKLEVAFTQSTSPEAERPATAIGPRLRLLCAGSDTCNRAHRAGKRRSPCAIKIKSERAGDYFEILFNFVRYAGNLVERWENEYIKVLVLVGYTITCSSASQGWKLGRLLVFLRKTELNVLSHLVLWNYYILNYLLSTFNWKLIYIFF